MKYTVPFLCLLFTLFAETASAQHHHMNMPQPVRDKKPVKANAGHRADKHHNAQADTTADMDMMNDQDEASSPDSMTAMNGAMNHSGGMGAMSHALSQNLPMSRNGSGTSWNPDASPMYMYMLHTRKWMYMIHGNFFVRYNKQDITRVGYRGDERWDAPDMLMVMGQRGIGRAGLFHFNTMFSLDALFTGQRGYPLLFQTGESAHGEPLIDRQHPHDLFAELSVSYAYTISKKSDAYLYVGYPGEPVLGATTFMHRASGMDNPDAPLSHHWVDATHITFGVVTLGYRYGIFKLESSLFTGREPNENRFDFDRPRFDSRSLRLWFNPNSNWSMQVSHGFINSPEALHSDENVYRTTASISYAKAMGGEKFFNATGLWGMNKQKEQDAAHAALLEAALRIQRLVVYSRYEWVQKSVEELNLEPMVFGVDSRFAVHAFTIGAGYDILRAMNIRTLLGTHLSFYHADKTLDPLYGKNPLAWETYLRFYPPLMKH